MKTLEIGNLVRQVTKLDEETNSSMNAATGGLNNIKLPF